MICCSQGNNNCRFRDWKVVDSMPLSGTSVMFPTIPTAPFVVTDCENSGQNGKLGRSDGKEEGSPVGMDDGTKDGPADGTFVVTTKLATAAIPLVDISLFRLVSKADTGTSMNSPPG